MHKVKLTNSQKALLSFVNSLTRTHTPRNPSILRNCLSYISLTIDRFLFGRQNIVHEACTVVTEGVRDHIIMNSPSFEDFSTLVSRIDEQLQDQIGATSLLNMLCLQLDRQVATETRENFRLAQTALGNTEEIFSTLTVTNSFDVGNLESYIGLLLDKLNESNSNTLYQEAKKLLSLTCLLTPRTILLRGISRAICAIVNGDNITTLQNEHHIEYCTTTSLNITAFTRAFREDIVSNLSAEFARTHPIINWLLNVSNSFNTSCTTPALYASLGAALGIFTARVHANYAVNQAQHNIVQALHNQTNYTITILNNRTIYENAVSNNSINAYNTNGTNITIYAPEHVSQYFPEHSGWFNGMVEWIPFVLRTGMLLCVLPRAFLSPVRRNFILRNYRSLEITPRERLAQHTLLASMAWRWACVTSMQPGRIVTSTTNDTFF
ncbi:hypothetical protein EDL81_01395 [Ehrlichia ruminantium]|uniref:Cpg1 family polymorphic protein n=1 Tax=Ehrlichia ruminantium TaxID=779 RepID=UPI00130ED736|nr:hypothetical protein [Ehrlichia ruminantium]QGR02334.1 hypothetical protein EDL81_01395 [Ehrlichia ruminantium]